MNVRIQEPFRSFLSNKKSIQSVTNYKVRHDPGVLVGSYPELVERIARLAFHNPDCGLFFRGQSKDWANSGGATCMYPSIYRRLSGDAADDRSDHLRGAFHRLKSAEELLVRVLRRDCQLGCKWLSRYPVLRWAIIQHYEICPTPLLDVSRSLHVAASFAHDKSGTSEPMLDVLATQEPAGAISVSAHTGIQIISLTRICPPEAKRPHFQDAYSLGQYPDANLGGRIQKSSMVR